MTSCFERTSIILASCQTQPVRLQPVPNVALSSPLNSGYGVFLGRVCTSSKIGHTQISRPTPPLLVKISSKKQVHGDTTKNVLFSKAMQTQGNEIF